MNNSVKQLNNAELYTAPTLEVVEIEIEQNILQSSGNITTTDDSMEMFGEDW